MIRRLWSFTEPKREPPRKVGPRGDGDQTGEDHPPDLTDPKDVALVTRVLDVLAAPGAAD